MRPLPKNGWHKSRSRRLCLKPYRAGGINPGVCVSEEEVLDMEDWNARMEAIQAYFDETAAKLCEEIAARLEALKASNEDCNTKMAAMRAYFDERIAKLREECEARLEAPTSSMGEASVAVPAAAPTTGATGFPDASVEGVDGQLTLEESSAGTAASDAVAEAASWTGDTAAPDASVERVAGELTLKAGSSSEICGERGASTHPFDPGTVFSLEVHYFTKSNSSSSSSSNNNSSSSSSSNHKDVTYAGILLRPFDSGKRCLQRMRRRIAVLGVAFPFDRGKEWAGKCSMESDGLCAKGCAGGEHLITSSASRLRLFA